MGVSKRPLAPILLKEFGRFSLSHWSFGKQKLAFLPWVFNCGAAVSFILPHGGTFWWANLKYMAHSLHAFAENLFLALAMLAVFYRVFFICALFIYSCLHCGILGKRLFLNQNPKEIKKNIFKERFWLRSLRTFPRKSSLPLSKQEDHPSRRSRFGFASCCRLVTTNSIWLKLHEQSLIDWL